MNLLFDAAPISWFCSVFKFNCYFSHYMNAKMHTSNGEALMKNILYVKNCRNKLVKRLDMSKKTRADIKVFK